MASSKAKPKATTVDRYLKSLPAGKRETLTKVRELVKENLPDGYQEVVEFGSICYVIPLDEYPDTYNGRPLAYAGIAAQKNHYAIYLMGAYADPAQVEKLEKAFAKAGKKFDMGKSCLRFKDLDDIPADAVGKVIAATPPKKFIKQYEAGRATAKTSKKK